LGARIYRNIQNLPIILIPIYAILIISYTLRSCDYISIKNQNLIKRYNI